MTEIDGVTYKITETQANCFKTAFGIFDSDADGYVSCESANLSPSLWRAISSA